MRIVITKPVSLKDGASYRPGVQLDVTQEELRRREFPSDSYRIKTPDAPTEASASKTPAASQPAK